MSKQKETSDMDINASIETLKQTMAAFESNPVIPLIASGGLTVWLISNLKSIFSGIKNGVLALVSFTVFNTYEDNRTNGGWMTAKQQFFEKIVDDAKTLWERTKQLDLNSNTVEQDGDCAVPRSLPYGFFIKWMYGKLVLCYRSQKQDSQKIIVNTTLNVFFARKNKFLKRLEDDLTSMHSEYKKQLAEKKIVRVYTNNSCSLKEYRSLDSIFTDGDIHKELYSDICKFIDNKEIYKSLNYPYKYSALLHGKPGTGKTSTILAIASALKRDIMYINMSRTTIDEMLDKVNARSSEFIYVFEDIDALSASVAESREDYGSASKHGDMSVADRIMSKLTLSLSDLLNITDGLLSSDGAICLFTTNHIEKLDPALLRAGRMNKCVEFKYLSSSTAEKMVHKYVDGVNFSLADGIKPAELQEDILNIMLKKKDKSALAKYKKQAEDLKETHI